MVYFEIEKLTRVFLPIASFAGVVFLFLYLGKYGMGFNEILGTLTTLIGYLFWFLSRYYLGKAYALLPEARYVVSDGIYSKIRHPLYISQMITLGGIIIFIENPKLWWLFLFVLLCQLYRKSQEEKLLIKKFVIKYTDYMKSTWF
ncbi:hypothetical protein N8083_01460 [Candidatus Pacebacteria bacterium]|nr:hypothetical protein [Candidatus Paceibacterota bacterium]